ncbi:MAG: dihydrofolate reductase [Candidatus Peregrinibacteria bacterium]|nr:dihydrofolate reductase [Candidatus Peregrinibacteria bacterium]
MNLKPRTYLIVAVDQKGGMGLKGKLPWVLKEDMKFFQKTTIHTDSMTFRNMIIMGRVTWESIPEEHRPLKGRKNVVITRNKDFKVPEGVVVAHSIQEAMKAVDERVADIFIIGGAKIFDQYLKQFKVDGIFVTRISKVYNCDTFFPKIPKNFKAKKLGAVKEGDVSYEYLLFSKK